MLIQFTHNPAEYIKGCMLNYTLIVKRQVERQAILLALGLILITVAYAGMNDKLITDDYLFAAGTFLVLVPANFLYTQFKRKKIYKATLTEHSQRLENTTITFNFTDEALLYNDVEMSINWLWNRFDNYTLYNDGIIIKTKSGYFFVISKQVLGNEKMNQLISLLKTKIQK